MTEEKLQAQEGLSLIKSAIVNLLRMHPEGLRNTDVTAHLGLHSDQNGRNRDYLAWSVLGLLMKEGLIIRKEKRYIITGRDKDKK